MDEKELKAQEEIAKIVHDVQQKVDKLESQGKDWVATAEYKSQIEKMAAHMEEIDKKAGAMHVDSAKNVAEKEYDAFCKEFVKEGRLEFKAMAADTLAAGGAFVLPHVVTAAVDALRLDISPIRANATVVNVASGVDIPKWTADATCGFVGESATRTATAGTTGKDKIENNEMYVYMQLTRKLLAQGFQGLESFITNRVAQLMAYTENVKFISGTGTGEPEGILTNATVLAAYIAQGNSESSTIAVPGTATTGMIGLYGALKEAYTNAKFYMNRKTFANFMAMKDADNHFILGLLYNAPTTQILGAPVVIAQGMPDIGANTYPIAYGDLKTAYMITDGGGQKLIMDPYTSKASGAVDMYWYNFLGGAVVVPEAIKVLKVAAS